ncbi:hypothetical protein V2J09_017521 [Rumex salicifolius]
MKYCSLLFLLMLPAILQADLSSDTQALIEFASKVRHSRRLNWNANTSASACTSWVGVSCNGDDTRVTGLRLPGVGLLGPIPAATLGKLDELRVLSLRSNYLSGELPSDMTSIPTLQFLFLQHNNLSGTLPQSQSLSPRLVALDLSSNMFTGPIPPTLLLNFTSLAMLNLQCNSLSGPIPAVAGPPPRRLKLLNLSHNSLTGSIPTSLLNFSATSFIGNSLCGPPLPLSCAASSTSTSVVDDPKLSLAALVGIVVAGCVVVIAVAVVWWCTKTRKGLRRQDKSKDAAAAAADSNKKIQMSSEAFGSGIQDGEKNKLVFFQGCAYNFDLEDLLRASAEVLGKGSYGTAYKAILDEGTTVVVKRLKEVGTARREFEQNMEMISKVAQHPNLLPLRAYYYSKDEKLLVYDYASSGSLALLLHGYRGNAGRNPLNWNARMKILGDIARGILHIHSECDAKLIHGNIKSSNVLLTRDLDGLVSDFGLTLLMNFQPSINARSVGYHAPEVIETRKASQKSDVYSFGVLLLEVLTGKAPLKSPHAHNADVVVDLPRWVQSVVREEWTSEVFDTELLRSPNAEEEMVHMLQIALACVARLPDTRPTMDQVLKMMDHLRQSAADQTDLDPPSSDERSKDSNAAASYTP